MTLYEIDQLTDKLSKARAELSAIITRLQLKQNALLNQEMPEVRRIVGRTADYSSRIIIGIDADRSMFVSPKSQVLNGIKFGLRKGIGGIAWEDEEVVIARAEKRFTPEQCKLLIKTEKTLRKKALATFPIPDIKAIGCTIEETGDVAFVSPVESVADKIVNTFLKKAMKEAQQEAAA